MPNKHLNRENVRVEHPADQRPDHVVEHPADQRPDHAAERSKSAVPTRSAAERASEALEALVLLTVPLTLGACAVWKFNQTALLTLVVAFCAIVLMFASWERRRPALRQIMPTVVLGALAAAGRVLFAAMPDVKPVTAICILAGVVFGRQSGFMVGALAAFVSNFFFGQGPWTPWQMYTWGLIGYLAGIFAESGTFDRRAGIYVFGVVSALLYGFVMSTWTLVGYVHSITWESALATYGAGMALDVVHAASTVVFLLIIYEPWRKKLQRIKRKFAL